jgi:peptidoglycan-N-acetylmuramic acid deacetylase
MKFKILNKKNTIYLFTGVFIFTFIFSMIFINKFDVGNKLLVTNASVLLSNKKISWGIKRNQNHEQPDVGSSNKSVLEKYNGICMGNSESKKVYLTFDAGYEAGYMEKILEVLKQNDVKACFFITAHYLNTQPELVKRMIDEGHIVGNHTPNYLMYGVVA